MPSMHVFLIAALSLDGFIGTDPSVPSTTWTSSADKKFFSERTKEAGVIVMGRKTYDTIGRALPGRLTIVMSSKVKSQKSKGDGVILSEVEGSPEIQELSSLPHPVQHELLTQPYFTSSSPTQIVERVAALGFSELAVCGGTSVYTQFLEAGLIHTMYLTVEPVVFGQGIPLFGKVLTTMPAFKVTRSQPLDEGLLITVERNDA
jgi:dihydrofolate reductase